jgi:Flp pilus assembly protein TadG
MPCWKDEHGVAAIEFALVAPLLVVLVIGMMIYSIYFTTWIAVTEAASEGARASVAGTSAAERASLATAQLQTVIDAYAPLLSWSKVGALSAAPVASNPQLFQVSFTYDFSGFGFNTLSALLPIPSSNPKISVIVSNGGY